jgi:hypothetical protein
VTMLPVTQRPVWDERRLATEEGLT